MRVSPTGIELIKTFESCRLKAYRDIVGVLTIGWGHTGSDVFPDQVISQAMADDLLVKDVARFEEGVNRLVKVELNQNQFDALVSFTYNVGINAFEDSTMLRLINQGKFEFAVQQFQRWNRAGGRVVAGLTRRRVAERNLFGKQETVKNEV
jgi:lysozyme